MKRILFIKLGAIGDVIQAAAATYHLKTIEPQFQVDWIIGAGIEKILHKLSFIDRLISIPDQNIYSGPYARRIYALCKGLLIILKSVRSYDEIYIGHTNNLYRLFALPAIAKNLSRCMLYPKIFTPPIQENRVSAYFTFLSNGKKLKFSDSELLLSLGNSMLNNAKQKVRFLPFNSKTVVLVPGGSKNLLRDDMLRRWPVERYAELAKKLLREGYAIVLVGGKDDSWVLPFFQGIEVMNLIGKTTLMELLQVFDQAQLVVSHDTGPLHIATLTKTPILSLFGPTHASAVVPLERITLRAMDAVGKVNCAPCYDGKNYATCFDPLCMKSHSVEDVYTSANNLLLDSNN